MANERETGGPAFPRVMRLHPYYPSGYHGEGDKSYEAETEDGLSVRDYFAAKALMGIYSNPREDYAGTTREDRAVEAYRAADAMLRVRNAK